MALQDDIFDVFHTLKGKPECAGFDRIIEHLNNLEVEDSRRPRVRSKIAHAVRACSELAGALITLDSRPNPTRATQVLWATKDLRDRLDEIDQLALGIARADEPAST